MAEVWRCRAGADGEYLEAAVPMSAVAVLGAVLLMADQLRAGGEALAQRRSAWMVKGGGRRPLQAVVGVSRWVEAVATAAAVAEEAAEEAEVALMEAAYGATREGRK
ncbi:hypothetical protein AB1Y20_003426 [Prymnesium parvum]|uniref:Uncharacterized protein n=1 Tax=Prymnesium parvum TaxID=97485 RepID=A0AB34JEF4_PRYPA|mmetsp:Transcript_7746/g.18619  ORF Transcript_7746/g.18619 Transcript_7746/m.18619 type:complete len:107 (-) Transcript_7746:87-407(-)